MPPEPVSFVEGFFVVPGFVDLSVCRSIFADTGQKYPTQRGKAYSGSDKSELEDAVSGLRKQAQSYLLTAKTDRTGSSVRCRRVYFSPAAFVTVSVSGHGTISPV